ncbi:MAG: hypothetical protein RL033_3367 [Pseudomonadota bacterium]
MKTLRAISLTLRSTIPLPLSSAARLRSVTLLCSAVLLGCGQESPPAPVSRAPYQPLVDGARWAYQHSDWTEQVTVTATSLDGEPAFLMTDSPNPSDSVRSDATVVIVAGRVLRKTKQEYLISAGDTATLQSSVDYGVGFTRFDESWGERAVGFKETPEYQRVETPAGGTARAPEARRHTFEILSLSESVQTSVGTFDCLKIKRTKDWEAEADGLDASDAEPKIFWFARGVGKVRELNPDTDRGELLSDYFIPE